MPSSTGAKPKKRKFRPTNAIMGSDGRPWVALPLEEDWMVWCRFVSEDGHPVLAEIRIVPKPRTEAEDEWLQQSLKEPPVRAARDDMALPKEERPRFPKRWPEQREPTPPSGGLTARAVRRVQVSPAHELLREAASQWLQHIEGEQLDYQIYFPGVAKETLSAPHRPGRKGRPDIDYVTVAVEYLKAVRGGSNRPVVETAAALSKHNKGTYMPAYVRDLLHEARKRGLLTHPSRGQAGGKLTDKALAVLRAHRGQVSQ